MSRRLLKSGNRLLRSTHLFVAMNRSRQLLVQQLRGKIRHVETASRNDDGAIVSSGSTDLDQMLPAGGYNRGTIIEWLAGSGSGAEFLSLLAARNASGDGGALVVIDRHNQFYPPAARALGINLEDLIVLQGSRVSAEDFCWSIDQSLRCPAVAAVWGGLPDFETPQIATRWLRRFQLSAESSGCLGLFIRNKEVRNQWCVPGISRAEIQWRMESQPGSSSSDSRRVRVSLVRCRGGTAGRSFDLEINTITGNVCGGEHAERIRQQQRRQQPSQDPLPLAPQLADPASGRRPARA